MFGGLFGGGTGPVATGVSTADLLKIGDNGNFAFQPNNGEAWKKFGGSLMDMSQQPLPQQPGTPIRSSQPNMAPQQPGVFEVQNRQQMSPEIMAMVQALRGQNG